MPRYHPAIISSSTLSSIYTTVTYSCLADMSIITRDESKNDPPRLPPTRPLSRDDALRIADRMESNPTNQRKSLESRQEASSKRSPGEQDTRSNYYIQIYRRLLCCSWIGLPKNHAAPTPLKREDRTSTFERGFEFAKRATSFFTRSPHSTK